MRLKHFAALLMFSTALMPVPAHAGIVESIVLAVSSLASALGVSVAGQAILGSLLFSALPSLGGALLFAAARFALNAAFNQGSGGVRAAKPQEIQANYQSSESPRFLCQGRVRIGGQIIFSEVKDGRLYKLVANCDSEMTQLIGYYLNDILVTLNGSNYVTNDEFKYGSNYYYRVINRNGTATQTAMAELTSVFTEWTASHRGVGICDTLLILDPVPVQGRAVLLRHRGTLGLGEPDITKAGYYGRVYDPRNDSTNGGTGSERYDDESTWGASLGNPALVWAWHRLNKERFANLPSDINWESVTLAANICEEQIADKYSAIADRYEISLAVNKNDNNNKDIEDVILASMDGTTFTDDEGRIGIIAGKYDSDPELVLYDEDIFEIESSDGNDGESLGTHYFASYMEPEFDFKETQSAVFASPNYEASDIVRTKKLPLYQVPNHNQAIRLTKAAVYRAEEPKRLALVAGLRALLAKQKRFLRLSLNSDPELSAVYEISSIQDSYDGLTVSLVLIRCNEDRWNLTEGEEGDRASFDLTVAPDAPPDNIADVDMVTSVDNIDGSFRIEATFPVPSRADYLVQIQYRLQSTTVWLEFSVQTSDGVAQSGIVADTTVQEVRWRVVTVTGSASDWSSIREVNI